MVAHVKKDDVKYFVLKMLGSPVVEVELDESHLDLCIERTCEIIKSSGKFEGNGSVFKLLAEDGSLIHAKLILGRIRAKYGTDKKGVNNTTSVPCPNACVPSDGYQLLEEGERQYHDWLTRVFGGSSK